MRKTWIIAKRELGSFFDSLIAYLLLIAFLGFSGFFTWLYGSDIFLRGQADLSAFFNTAYWTLFFFIPALTMRSLAEERRSGTLDLLLTKALGNWQIIFGKFLAAWVLIAIALACSLPYYATVAQLGNMDHGAVLCGYLALLLMSSMYVAIGIFASSSTTNQIVAFLVALFIGLLFHLIFQVLAPNFTGALGNFFNQISTGTHFDSMSRGVIDSRDLIFFLSITVLGLSLAEVNLAKRVIAGK